MAFHPEHQRPLNIDALREPIMHIAHAENAAGLMERAVAHPAPNAPWALRALATALVVFLLLTGTSGAGIATAQTPPALPAVDLDALDPDQWSVNALFLAPGQHLRITNRGVLPHTFTIAAWGLEIDLPTLETVEIVVPTDVSPGDRVTFSCSVGDHRSNGQEGTITIIAAEDTLATAPSSDTTTVAPDQFTVELRDDYSFTPSQLMGSPGQLIELRNSGVLEHHFVVDEWDLNVTVPPGGTTLVQIPSTATPGQVVIFYCSVPNHREQGMSGQLTIVADRSTSASAATRGRLPTHGPDLGRFVPDASVFSPGWQRIRTGNARAIIPELENLNVKIFPGEGRGAAYIGPNGSRAVIVALPFATTAVPTNQLDDAVAMIETAMTATWKTNGRLGASYDGVPNPAGCDVVDRIGGITNLYTLPAGGTSCQLRGTGVVVFVAVEGEVGDASSVQASDLVTERLLKQALSPGS